MIDKLNVWQGFCSSVFAHESDESLKTCYFELGIDLDFRNSPFYLTEVDSLVQVGKCDPTETAKASHLQHASVFKTPMNRKQKLTTPLRAE